MSSYGVLGQWPDIDAWRAARARLHEMGYTRVETFSAWPAADATPGPRFMAPTALLTGAVGFVFTLWLQWMSATDAYRIDVGGRPAASWPAFIPAALEVALLFGAMASLVVFFAQSGLPRLYRPEFNVPWFEEASRDGFLLLIRADDPQWDEHRCAHDVAVLDPMRYAAVPA